METQETQPGEQQGNNINPPTASIPPNVTDEIAEEQYDTHQTPDTQTPPQQPVKIIIEQDNRSDRHARNANRISFGALLLAAIAVIYTYKLFDATKYANVTSDSALALANRQFKQSQIDNAIAHMEQKQKDITDSSNTRIRFKLDSTSTQAQIDAFKETQKEFAVSNEPYLQIGKVWLDSFYLNGRIVVSFNIDNLGNYPVKIIESKNGMATKVVPPDTSNTNYSYKNGTANLVSPLATKEYPAMMLLRDDKILEVKRYNKVFNEDWWIYCYGYFKYRNLITKRVKTYYYMFQIKPNMKPRIIY